MPSPAVSPTRLLPSDRPARVVRALWAGAVFLAVLLPPARADEGDIAVVSSRTAEDYVRTRQPDGTYAVELYAFGPGGFRSGPLADPTIDKLTFVDVAKTIAPSLAARKYLPSRDPEKTKLLIMVYWGTTAGTAGGAGSLSYQNLQSTQLALPPPPPPPPSGDQAKAPAGGGGGGAPVDPARDALLTIAAMENRIRDRADAQNAGILGYDAALREVRGHDGTPLNSRQRDLIDELEDNRYYVVLMAYDFQLLLKEKKHKLLWETRFSINQRGNDFDKQLAAMAQTASRYYGQDTHGLARKPLPQGQVRLDELQVIGVVPDK